MDTTGTSRKPEAPPITVTINITNNQSGTVATLSHTGTYVQGQATLLRSNKPCGLAFNRPEVFGTDFVWVENEATLPPANAGTGNTTFAVLVKVDRVNYSGEGHTWPPTG